VLHIKTTRERSSFARRKLDKYNGPLKERKQTNISLTLLSVTFSSHISISRTHDFFPAQEERR
jgi:hypothetical protein